MDARELIELIVVVGIASSVRPFCRARKFKWAQRKAVTRSGCSLAFFLPCELGSHSAAKCTNLECFVVRSVLFILSWRSIRK